MMDYWLDRHIETELRKAEIEKANAFLINFTKLFKIMISVSINGIKAFKEFASAFKKHTL